MMGSKKEAQAALFYEFSLEDHVPMELPPVKLMLAAADSPDDAGASCPFDSFERGHPREVRLEKAGVP